MDCIPWLAVGQRRAMRDLDAWAKPVPGPDRGWCAPPARRRRALNALTAHASTARQTILPTLHVGSTDLGRGDGPKNRKPPGGRPPGVVNFEPSRDHHGMM